MLVLLALGGITFVVWVMMVWVSFLDENQVASLLVPVKRSKQAVRDGEGRGTARGSTLFAERRSWCESPENPGDDGGRLCWRAMTAWGCNRRSGPGLEAMFPGDTVESKGIARGSSMRSIARCR